MLLKRECRVTNARRVQLTRDDGPKLEAARDFGWTSMDLERFQRVNAQISIAISY